MRGFLFEGTKMAELAPSPKQQFFDNAGNPAAGYRLTTYAAGTTTLQATFTNRAATASNSNPIILNQRGEAVIFLDPSKVYDFKFESPDGAQVWTQQDVAASNGMADLASTAAGKGAEMVAFKQAGAGAVERTLLEKGRETVSVKDFGAVGDGVADDTAAINAAIASLPELGGKAVFPNGTYRITAPITITNKAVALIGSGREGTRIIQATSNTDGISFVSNTASNAAAGNGTLKNTLTIRGISLLRMNGTTGGKAVAGTWAEITDNVQYFVADDILVYSYADGGSAWNYGFHLTNANGVRMNNVSIKGNVFQTSEVTAEPYTMEAAIYLTGGTASGKIDHFYSNISGGCCNKFFKVDAWYEGIYIANFEMVQVSYGVHIAGYATSQNPVWNMTNGHIDFRRCAVQASNVMSLQISNVNAIKHGGIAPVGVNGSGFILNNCTFPAFTNVLIHNYHSSNSWGFNTDAACYGGLVTNCTIRGWNQAGALVNHGGWKFHGNHIDYCGVGLYLNTSGNQVGVNFYQNNTTNMTVAAGNFVQDRQMTFFASGTYGTTGVTQTITVPVPAGTLPDAPKVVHAIETFNTGFQLVFVYDKAASSATSLVLKAQRNDGASITAGGNYNIAVSAVA